MHSWNQEITQIQGSYPDLVIVKNSDLLGKVHYFYFAIELGKRPISDVEPVRAVHKLLEKNCIVLTRVHFNILVMWINPKIYNDLPITRFLPGSHTPLVISENFKYRIEKIGTDHKWREQFEYWLGWAWLRIFLKSTGHTDLGKCEKYGDRIVEDITYLEKYKNGEILFDLRFLREKAKELAIIGNEDDVNNTLDDIKKMNIEGKLTVDAIEGFIKNYINDINAKNKQTKTVNEDDESVKIGNITTEKRKS